MKRILVLSLLLCLSLRTASAARAQADGPVYVVAEGDSYWAIADTFKVTIPDLLAANGFSVDHIINPGDRLVIPGYEGIHGVLASRMVELGDTLATLSLRTGIPADTLMRLNRLTNPQRLYAGQALVVVEPEDGTAPASKWETGRALTLSAGTPLLALAAAEGKSPWELAGVNNLSSPADQFSGRTLFEVGGDKPLRAWPDPVADIRFRQLPLMQGMTGEMYLTLAREGTAEGTLGDYVLNIRAWDGKMVALQGIHATAVPKSYPLKLKITAADGRTIFFEQDVQVVSGKYPVEPDLKVPPETLNLDTIAAEAELTQSIVAPFTEERYWTAVFLKPAIRDIGSLFGNRRSYNNGAYYYYHTGVDYYGRMNEPVLAPAPGRVVYTDKLVICGNTTVIDHGWGVYTRYCHQSAFKVQPGDTVVPGQEIGLIGNTGRVDGPHLHFELWVGGVQVNPLTWMQEVFP
jgi:murein DD-endopeptidase MepM/ murein hydrolase activator NlpD